MLRVLHCIYDDPDNPWVGGGGALRVREIYRRLTNEVDATVLTGNFPGAVDGPIQGVRYQRVGFRRPYPLSRLTYGIQATRMLAEGNYDVGLFDFSVYTPIRLPQDRPVGLVVHMLHAPTAEGRWGGPGAALVARAERAGLRSARWVSTTSRWMMQQLEPLVAPGAKLVPVGSGVPAEFAAVRRAEADYLLYYGRIDLYHKGLDVLLEAFGRLRRAHPELQLIIAGRGKDARRLYEMIERLDVREGVEVRLQPDRAAVLELMAGALALVMPSRLEGLPMVPAEALAAGVPVIATRVGAMEEIVTPGVTGLLVSPDSPVELEAAMKQLVADEHLRDRMSAEARRSAERFSWERVARAHLDFLHAVAGQRDGPVPPPHSE